MTSNRNVYEDWIPEEWSGPVIQRVNYLSAVEAVSRREPMGTDTKHVPRSAGVGVEGINKGDLYSLDESTNDEVLLTARKIGRAIKVAEEDLVDTASVADIINTKKVDWATSYAKYLDNATLAVTATASMPTIPFDSVYFALTQTNTATGYTANDNITFTVTAGSPSYDELSAVFGIYEQSDYFDDSSSVVIAHPAFREALRSVKDTNGMPIFVGGQGGDSGTPDSLFGVRVRWTTGMRETATATASPASANPPLLLVGNPQYLVLGVRSGPESAVIPANISLSDEAQLKMRARRGFAVGHEKAFSLLVDDGSA